MTAFPRERLPFSQSVDPDDGIAGALGMFSGHLTRPGIDRGSDGVLQGGVLQGGVLQGGVLQLAWDGHHDEAATLVRRPMADMTERDLGLFAAARYGSTVPAQARPLLDLTRECLKARFAVPVDCGPVECGPTEDARPYS